ncbi:MAG: BatD family protein [Bacteroidales bacterium]|nr:BatD family protein [Bacteroidales bacterium]
MKTLVKILPLFFYLTIFSQDVTFIAKSPKQVLTGQQFVVSYTLNANPSDFKPPSFSPFEILSGPNRSQSTSIQFVNGQFSQQTEISYSYYLTCDKEGTYTIPPAEATVNGKKYKSNSLTIEVVKGPQQSSQYAQQKQQTPEQQERAPESTDDVFLYISVSKNEVYQGETFTASIYIYTRVGIVGFEDIKFPSFTGFWTEDLETPQNISLSKQVLNGKTYNVGLLKRILLIPQQSGKLTIPPAEAKVVVQKRIGGRPRTIWDEFFTQYQNVSVKVKSEPISITVKPLPENRPTSFKGAVGNFSVESNISNTSIKMNEAITYTLKLSGKGNIKLIDLPKPEFPQDFEVFDPKVSTSMKDYQTGTKTVSYIIIPRHYGTYTIPGIEFSYFDPLSKSFKTIKLNDIKINVSKDTSATSYSGIIASFSKSEVNIIGKDIKYIKTNIEPLKNKEKYIFTDVLNILFYPASSFILITLLFLRRKNIKERQNVLAYRNRKANKMAKKRLAVAYSYLKKNEQTNFYNEINIAMWKYLSDKLMIPVSELTKEKVIETLKTKNIDETLINNILQIIDTCELARFAPATINVNVHDIYKQTIDIIKTMETKV